MSDRPLTSKKLPEGVVLLDSLGDLTPHNTCAILVCGSHCGGNGDLARHVKSCHVKAVFLNNAGVGKNQAGIRELANYDDEGILACAVDHYSAEIGMALDTYERGVISHLSKQAHSAGVLLGDSVQKAIAKMISNQFLAQKHEPANTPMRSSKQGLKKQKKTHVDGIPVTVTDSITFLNESNAGDIVVCGSHGGMSAGKYAKKHRVKAVFFNDAGIGKNGAGVKSLEGLSNAGIPACTVDCMSAEIFNGQDLLEHGVISVCNQRAKDCHIAESLSVKEAIKKL